MIKGIAASPGIEIGKAHLIKPQQVDINTEAVIEENIDGEIKRFDEAVGLSKLQLKQIKEKAEKELGADKAEIFGAHLMILEDPVFLDEIVSKIKTESITADNATSQVVKNYVEIFNNLEDEYMKERAADIKDVGERIVKNILGVSTDSFIFSEKVIIIAKDLTPSDTAQMDKDKVLAFATDMGGRTSHTAIMARSLEIPAVVGLVDITEKVQDGDLIVIDGNKGIVSINPDETTLKEYETLKRDYMEYRRQLKELKDLPAETGDKLRRVELSANIGTPRDVKGAIENGAEGVGLYRTEFLYMDRDALPTEEEQFEAYREVIEKMAPRPIIIRTLDIGGDKKLSYLDMPEELNPFMGWRAIRMCLDRPDILKTQLRAILRASIYGNAKIMYPMVSGSEEVCRANAILNEAKQELKAEGISFDENLEVGIMVEIPSAAVTADILVKEVDFFSIGTNDLIQYTLAVDRMNEHISHLYEPLHPAVLRLIKNVIDASHKAGKWTGMCGEMAGDTSATAILLGMGLDEFSMSAPSIPQVKKIIRSLTYEEAQHIAQKALSMDKPEDIRNMVEQEMERIR
ncbi:MAG TPA: phosphoenolpyruvate--protein phosphotransferase [Thermoanaerobacterales bacterium]|jgi:phosphotransferase system enzyme I (PtsI)|nr:phosphoenolpyruvate--protein phosphotransferase [Thermoanaerobacterales bacterium]